jgi:hypothetical protein
MLKKAVMNYIFLKRLTKNMRISATIVEIRFDIRARELPNTKQKY